jgi:hypothetical protein
MDATSLHMPKPALHELLEMDPVMPVVEILKLQ